MHHGKKHLRRHNNRFCRLVAGFDNTFLNRRKKRQRTFNAKISAGNHNNIAFFNNSVQIINRHLPFQLGNNRQISTQFFHFLTKQNDIFRRLYKGKRNGINTKFNANSQILFIFFSQCRQINRFIRNSKPFSGSYNSVVFCLN